MKTIQAGELIVVGSGSVLIPLLGIDTKHTKVFAEFDDAFISAPCEPHSYDSLEYDFDNVSGLVFTWSVSHIRVIKWRIDY